jgi:dTDP-4-dehydrorhamnose 3,5-epimerase
MGPSLENLATELEEVRVLKPRRFTDTRGWFCETWNERRLRQAGIDATFVQDNVVFSPTKGTLRGLHFQRPPAAQAKLVFVIQGAILDVVVDVRAGSPTFGKHVATTITADGGEQIWVPAGFAHGYCTMASNSLVFYKVTSFYDPTTEGGVRFDDPNLDIRWPVEPDAALVSEKDRALPLLADMPIAFRYSTLP